MFQEIAPWLGYLATLFLAIALIVNNDIKFRWINSLGCICFVVYGILLNAVPIILTNLLLLCINIWFLFRIYNRKELFELLEFSNEPVIIEKFLNFYQQDITAYFPAFKREQLEGNLNFVVLRDLVIANIFSARISEEGNAEVILNFTVAKYRDYKVGKFIFEKEKQFLLSKGVKKLCYRTVDNKRHLNFLLKMGFRKEILNGHKYITKKLAD